MTESDTVVISPAYFVGIYLIFAQRYSPKHAKFKKKKTLRSRPQSAPLSTRGSRFMKKWPVASMPASTWKDVFPRLSSHVVSARATQPR